MTIHTRLGGEVEPIALEVKEGHCTSNHMFAHFAIPVREAWDDVQLFCASVIPFRAISDIDPWCRRHGIRRGEAMPISQLAELARRWYGNHLDRNWIKWTQAEAQAIFRASGLSGAFWQLVSPSERF
jgi:hypothetical protein